MIRTQINYFITQNRAISSHYSIITVTDHRENKKRSLIIDETDEKLVIEELTRQPGDNNTTTETYSNKLHGWRVAHVVI